MSSDEAPSTCSVPDHSGEYVNGRSVRYTRDGNAWCCHFIDFVDLQESPAGFGNTKKEAKADFEKFLKEEGIK